MKFKSRLTYRNFIDYFSNKLEKKEKHAFEKKMMQDDFDSEAFDGLSKVSAQELEQDLVDLNRQLHARTQKRKRRIPIWFPYAASIIILFGLGSVLFYLNQYSVHDEMIGAQMEETEKSLESPIVEAPAAPNSEAIDLMEAVEEDLNLEFSDADEIIEEELMIVSVEEEVEEEIIPMLKRKESELILPVKHLAVADEESKMETEISAESMQRALEGQVAGVEVQKSRRQKTVKKSIANNTLKSARIISGKVVDEDEMPLPGVSIVVKGTTKGVVTDYDGQFKLDASDTSQDYKLVASFIGFESKEVKGQADTSLLVILETNQVNMDEIVVVGYGSSKTERGSTSWKKAKPNQFASIAKFEEHLIQDLDYSKLEHLHGAYKLKLSFVVTVSGTIEDLVFKGNPDSVLISEIKNLILNGETWQVAESKGEPVSSKVRMVLKLHFE